MLMLYFNYKYKYSEIKTSNTKYKYKYSKIVFKYSKIQILKYLTPSLIISYINLTFGIAIRSQWNQNSTIFIQDMFNFELPELIPCTMNSHSLYVLSVIVYQCSTNLCLVNTGNESMLL